LASFFNKTLRGLAYHLTAMKYAKDQRREQHHQAKGQEHILNAEILQHLGVF